MKLLHPVVEITPGKPGTQGVSAPVEAKTKIEGSAVLRLTNSTQQNNAYIVRLSCADNPFWQESWYTIKALLPAGADNAPPPDRQDVRGPRETWVQIFVPRNATRDILIRFNLPPTPDSRAGQYHYSVDVETKVMSGGPAVRRKDRIESEPGIANVRPFYRWSLDITPEHRKVGLVFIRSREFEVVVRSECNEWLYCDIQLPVRWPSW